MVYGINTRLSSVTNTTPYHVTFGQALRLDSDFWTLVKTTGVVGEEDLPERVGDLQCEVIADKEDDYNDCCGIIDNNIVVLVE